MCWFVTVVSLFLSVLNAQVGRALYGRGAEEHVKFSSAVTLDVWNLVATDMRLALLAWLSFLRCPFDKVLKLKNRRGEVVPNCEMSSFASNPALMRPFSKMFSSYSVFLPLRLHRAGARPASRGWARKLALLLLCFLAFSQVFTE